MGVSAGPPRYSCRSCGQVSPFHQQQERRVEHTAAANATPGRLDLSGAEQRLFLPRYSVSVSGVYLDLAFTTLWDWDLVKPQVPVSVEAYRFHSSHIGYVEDNTKSRLQGTTRMYKKGDNERGSIQQCQCYPIVERGRERGGERERERRWTRAQCLCSLLTMDAKIYV